MIAPPGALRRAISVPLRYATKPSSYFMFSVSVSNDDGSPTVNGTRTSAVLAMPAIVLCRSSPILDV